MDRNYCSAYPLAWELDPMEADGRNGEAIYAQVRAAFFQAREALGVDTCAICGAPHLQRGPAVMDLAYAPNRCVRHWATAEDKS